MGATFIGFVLGLAAGAVSGTAGGAFAGGVIGAFIGVTAHVVAWMRLHLGDEPTVERHVVMCEPFGQMADCELVGDLGTKRWYDVKSCQLLAEPAHVDCDKGCVKLMNMAHVRPGQGCTCHLVAAENLAAPRATVRA